MKKILFIGGGKMMQAITAGLVRQGWGPDRIAAVEPNELAAIEVERLGCAVYRSAGDALGSLAEAGIIVLAVKPQVMRDALLPLTGKITSQQLVISIAAGLRVGDLLRWLDGGTGCMRSAQMVRAMPNTPALIQKGIAGLYAAPHLTAVGRSDAEQLMGAVGEVVWFEEESMLDAVTAVSGSGPAYVFYFLEALESAAQELGFSPDAARKFARQTFLGSVHLACAGAESPATLRANVTSRHGTTEAAISAFDQAQMKEQFVRGVRAAAKRAQELGDQLSKAKSC
ncbi:MAG: pyrroline-5-carboxylate reductase [Usitatibacteraceae bacterium]